MTRRVRTLCAVLLTAAALVLLGTHIKPVGASARYPFTAATRTAQCVPCQPQGSVNPNTACADDLITLYGVGPKLAQAIIAEREQNGPFDYVNDLTTVKGVGKKKLEGFRDQLALSSPQP